MPVNVNKIARIFFRHGRPYPDIGLNFLRDVQAFNLARAFKRTVIETAKSNPAGGPLVHTGPAFDKPLAAASVAAVARPLNIALKDLEVLKLGKDEITTILRIMRDSLVVVANMDRIISLDSGVGKPIRERPSMPFGFSYGKNAEDISIPVPHYVVHMLRQQFLHSLHDATVSGTNEALTRIKPSPEIVKAHAAARAKQPQSGLDVPETYWDALEQ